MGSGAEGDETVISRTRVRFRLVFLCSFAVDPFLGGDVLGGRLALGAPQASEAKPGGEPNADTSKAKANEAARRLFAQAEARFAAGEYEAALALFRQAMATAPHDALLFNLAVCLERLGRTSEARETYEAAARSPQLNEEARGRARTAAMQLQPVPLPAPPEAPRPAALDLAQPAASPAPRRWLSPWGWGGVAAAGAGTAAATTLWILGSANKTAFEDAVSAGNVPRATQLADRGDAFDTWHKVSLGAAVVGVAVVIVDALRQASAAAGER